MSALWSKSPGLQTFDLAATRQLVPRQVPYLTAGQYQFTSAAGNYRSTIISSLFADMKTTWMYTATVQLALNGSEPSWSSDGWSFTPLDLSQVSAAAKQRHVQHLGSGTGSDLSSLNVTVVTSATRARLECSEYDFLSTPMDWLTEQNVTDPTAWQVDSNPKLIEKGFELGLDAQNISTPVLSIGNMSYTTFFVSMLRLACCDNVTDDQIGEGSVGYWSSDLDGHPGTGSYSQWPDLPGPWPVNFTVKWIHGKPLEGFHPVNYTSEFENMPFAPRLLWAEEPAMTAIGCTPVIETANASVVVDVDTAQVLAFDILGAPQPDEHAWTDPFNPYVSDKDAVATGSWAENVTVSHGVLFLTALLGAADLSMLTTVGSWNNEFYTEVADERFKIRMPGLNADFMSYSMLSLANGDHESLLDPETLIDTAQKTFSTLYQHFASFNLSTTDGNFVFQAFDAQLPPDIGVPLNTSNLRRLRRDGDGAESISPPPTAPQTATLRVSQPVELLEMSVPAAWVCMSILICLLIVGLSLAYASRGLGRRVGRRIESIADVAYLTAGSDKLLEMTRTRSPDEMKRDRETKFRLGWFEEEEGGKGGWRIEVVSEGYGGGRLEEVVTGKQGYQTQERYLGEGAGMEMVSLRSHT